MLVLVLVLVCALVLERGALLPGAESQLAMSKGFGYKFCSPVQEKAIPEARRTPCPYFAYKTPNNKDTVHIKH